MSAREEVLARVRAAHAAAPPPELTYDRVERAYRSTSDLDHEALVERLVDRLLDYKALVRHCGPDEVAATVAAALGERGVRSVVVPAGLEPELAGGAGRGDGLHVDEGQLTRGRAGRRSTGWLPAARSPSPRPARWCSMPARGRGDGWSA